MRGIIRRPNDHARGADGAYDSARGIAHFDARHNLSAGWNDEMDTRCPHYRAINLRDVTLLH
jgi:hypothetical protein